MRTAEEIKKGLEHCRNDAPCIECPYYDKRNRRYACEDELLSDSLALIQQLEIQAPKWTSVYTKMPEDGERTLIVNGDGDMEVLYYHKEWPNAFCSCGGLYKVYNATHWMPLPEPPRE